MTQKNDPWFRMSMNNRNIVTFSQMTKPNVTSADEIAPMQTEGVNYIILVAASETLGVNVDPATQAVSSVMPYKITVHTMFNIAFWNAFRDPVANQIFRDQIPDDGSRSVYAKATDGI